ncbi:MAG: DUF4124 domain-containing protein [Chromatocurvus sp.]
MLIRQPRHVALIALLFAASAFASATEIYKHIDADGNITFSDQPPAAGETAEKVHLRELNTTPATTPSAGSSASDTAEASNAPEQPEFAIRIASPTDETTIAMGPGNVTVTAQATPPLGRLEALQLYMDGEAVGDPQRGTTWSLEGLLRGPHDLAIERLDRRGNSLARSESVRIYVLRPSVNQPARP